MGNAPMDPQGRCSAHSMLNKLLCASPQGHMAIIAPCVYQLLARRFMKHTTIMQDTTLPFSADGVHQLNRQQACGTGAAGDA